MKHEPTGYPWHSFFGARFGWRDQRAVLFRGVNGANAQTGYTRPVSPDYLEVRLGGERSFLFTGGLPFLQRHGSRMADVILVPEGERGADASSCSWRPTATFPCRRRSAGCRRRRWWRRRRDHRISGLSNWLAHVDMPSLILTAMRPIAPGEGANRAVAARFIEMRRLRRRGRNPFRPRPRPGLLHRRHGQAAATAHNARRRRAGRVLRGRNNAGDVGVDVTPHVLDGATDRRNYRKSSTRSRRGMLPLRRCR